MYKRGDFHIHSVYSDGALKPSDIVRFAKIRGIDILAITDHNTTNGAEETIKAGIEQGVKVIPGVELSTRFNKTKVHILGYFKDDSYKNELLQEILKAVKNDKISVIKSLFGSSLDFYGYKNKLHVQTGINILKIFGAVVVLAHPLVLPLDEFHVIRTFGVNGIEAKYFRNTPEETEFFIKVAKENNLLYTAGSDFHTHIDMFRSHGVVGDVYLNEEEIYDFLYRGGFL